jgi:cell fate (sporulation/competence/biofilm development) regulator YlbF (YheA/YmcA/DUF963 family)
MIKGTKVSEQLTALCQSVLDSRQFKDANEKIEAFLADEAARTEYSSYLALVSRIRTRQDRGFEPTAGEVLELEKAHAAAVANPLISDFNAGTAALKKFKQDLLAYFDLAFELARVPTEEDFEGTS